MMKWNRRLPLRWLAFAVVMTAMVSTVTLSRYVTTVSGSDSARVAKFSVVLDAQKADAVTMNGSVTAEDSQTKEYRFTVRNDSEVAIDYTLTVIFGQALPAGIEVTMDDKNVSGATPDPTAQAAGSALTFQGYTLDPNNQEEHTLKIKATYVDAQNQVTSVDLNSTVSIRMDAQQKD